MNEGIQPQKMLEERINTWVQIAGIFVAAFWAVYTFVFKEIWAPDAVKVNTTLGIELSVQEVGDDGRDNKMVPLAFKVSAENPSTRPIHLLHSIWLVYGHKSARTDKFDTERAQRVLNSDEIRMESRFTENESIELVAAGRLFDDVSLVPNEKVARTEILFIPPGTFDSVELLALAPSSTGEVLKICWKLGQESDLDYNAKATISRDPECKTPASDNEVKKYEFYTAVARTKLAL